MSSMFEAAMRMDAEDARMAAKGFIRMTPGEYRAALAAARKAGAQEERERLAKLAEGLPMMQFDGGHGAFVQFEPADWLRSQGEG